MGFDWRGGEVSKEEVVGESIMLRYSVLLAGLRVRTEPNSYVDLHGLARDMGEWRSV